MAVANSSVNITEGVSTGFTQTNQTVYITTTGLATYSLAARTSAGSTATILNNSNSTQSVITWNKISVQQPVTQTADYLYGTVSGTVSGANVTFTLANTAGNLGLASNVITLNAGKTYRLNANLRVTSAGTAISVNPEWYNLTTASTLTNGSLVSPTWTTNNDMALGQLEYVITPTVNTQVILRGRTAVPSGSITSFEPGTQPETIIVPRALGLKSPSK